MEDAKLRTALDDIWQASVDPRAWSRVQASTEVLLGAMASQLAIVDHADGNRFFSRTSVIREIDTDLQDVMPSSEPVRFAAARPHWRQFVDYDYIDETGMRRSAFYDRNAYFDITYRLGLRLLDTPGKSTAIVWMWPRSAGHVQDRELKLLEAIRLPLLLAAMMGEHRASDVETEDCLIAKLRVPAFILRQDGTLMASNRPGDAALVSRDAVELDEGRLVARFRPGRAALARLVADVDRRDDPFRVRPAHAILPTASGRGPAAFAAVPLSRRHHFIRGGSTLVLLAILNAGRPGHRPAGNLLRP